MQINPKINPEKIINGLTQANGRRDPKEEPMSCEALHCVVSFPLQTSAPPLWVVP